MNINKINHVLHNPTLLWVYAVRKFSPLLPDKLYLQLLFHHYCGKWINWKNPTTFNEKLQWLKIYNRRPEYTMMVDKVAVKDFVAKTIGEEYVIPTLGVWNDPDEIDFDKLPNQFVLKCNHNSGGLCICKDKSKLNIEQVKANLRKALQYDYYWIGREWPYKNVKRKIIAEKYMEDNSSPEGLNDFKFMCFGGKVQCSFVCSDRYSKDGLKVTFYDKDWARMPFERHYPSSDKDVNMPHQYHKMIELAEKLSQKIPFVRTDFYEINGNLYFGELTFFPGNGFEEFRPEEWDEQLGKLIILPPPTHGILIENEGFVLLLTPMKKECSLSDYKFYCFNGEPHMVMVSTGRFEGNLCFDYYDMDWNKLDLIWDRPNSPTVMQKPSCFGKMKEICREISKGIPHVRVDLYCIEDKPYFGEMTFFDNSGFGYFQQKEWDRDLGELITLPNKTCND